jgi:hypothetical protein
MAPTRPGQNSNGQAKQPSANPQGQAAQTPPGQAPSTAPHGALPQQLQLRVQYHDLSPGDQAQVAQNQLGVDPYMMLKAGQQSAMEAAQIGQQGDPHGPVPNTLTSPGIPEQAGVAALPHDISALYQLMQRGYSPGASAGEHMMAQNAHSIARAQEQLAMQSAQNVGQHADMLHQLGGILQKLVMAGQPPQPQAPQMPMPQMSQTPMQAQAPQMPQR